MTDIDAAGFSYQQNVNVIEFLQVQKRSASVLNYEDVQQYYIFVYLCMYVKLHASHFHLETSLKMSEAAYPFTLYCPHILYRDNLIFKFTDFQVLGHIIQYIGTNVSENHI